LGSGESVRYLTSGVVIEYMQQKNIYETNI